MASSIARVGSPALIELQTDLKRLSTILLQISEEMNADMTRVHDYWQDGKYQEFVQAYQPQIRKCEEIATRYEQWCSHVLQPTIDRVIAVETTDVGGGGGSVGGGMSVGSDVGSSSTGAISDQFSGFKL